MHVDVCFRLHGEQLPLDHGYALYGAISRRLPEAHEQNDWGIHPVYGARTRPGVLALNDKSMLKIRMRGDEINDVLGLAGKQLDVDGDQLKVGVPEVHPLEPAEALKSRYVTIKGYMERDEFQGAVGRQLEELLDTEDELPGVKVGERRVMEIDGYTIVGFRVGLEGLSREESMTLQTRGIGGRRKMGAGIFRPGTFEGDTDE